MKPNGRECQKYGRKKKKEKTNFMFIYANIKIFTYIRAE